MAKKLVEKDNEVSLNNVRKIRIGYKKKQRKIINDFREKNKT